MELLLLRFHWNRSFQLLGVWSDDQRTDSGHILQESQDAVTNQRVYSWPHNQ